MRFESDQNLAPHRGFLLEFNTDIKAVISYLFRSRLLILQARTITVIKMVYTIYGIPKSKMAISNARQAQNSEYIYSIGIGENTLSIF